MAKDSEDGQTGAIDWEAAERAALAEEDDGPPTGGAAEPPPDLKLPGERDIATPATPKPAPTKPGPGPMANTAPTHTTRLQTFGEMLKKALPKVRNIIPKHVDGERLFSIAYMAMERNPKLLECTAISVLRGVIIGAQLGLDVSGVGGMAYLVPYRNTRTNTMEAQFIIGYKGMIDLARRSKDVAWIYSGAVYANEQFDFVVNPIPKIFHKPLNLDEDDAGDFLGTYAIAVFRDKDVPPQPFVMSKVQIDKIRSRSKAKDNGPWVTDYVAMGKKSSIRGLCGLLPQSPELAAALAIEDRVEAGESVTAMALPGELPDDIPAERTDEGPSVEAPAGGNTTVTRKLSGNAKKRNP